MVSVSRKRPVGMPTSSCLATAFVGCVAPPRPVRRSAWWKAPDKAVDLSEGQRYECRRGVTLRDLIEREEEGS